MTKTYVVSGCGAKFDDALWTVPTNVEIHFYFPCMRKPQFYKTRSILEELILDVGMFPDRVAVAGEAIPIHFCWAHPGERPQSGVFRRQTGQLAIDLADSSPTRPVALRHVVQELTAERSSRTTAIHWIVRSEEMTAELASLDCLLPPRLRNGLADDRAESVHVPLDQTLDEQRALASRRTPS
ncbi:MAG: hypothetical protein ABJD97_12735 [Betaproteobacteria bacterium]